MSVFSKIADDASLIAEAAGFVPDHMMIHIDGCRREVIVSGKDGDGNVCQIEYSVTDPKKIYPRNAG